MLGFAGKCPGEHAFELRRCGWNEGAERSWRRAEPLHGDGSRRRSLEGEAPCRRLVKREREAVDVGRRRWRRSLEDFRREVRCGAEDFAGVVGGHRAGNGLCHAEVGDLHDPVVVDEDVLGLDVAMDHSLVMGLGQRGCRLAADAHHIRPRQPAMEPQEVPQRRPVHVLHDEEVPALMLADVEDGDDVGVLQPGDGSGFVFEGVAELPGGREAVIQDLHGDGAIEALVAGKPHLCHATPADEAFQPVSPSEQIGRFQRTFPGLQRLLRTGSPPRPARGDRTRRHRFLPPIGGRLGIVGSNGVNAKRDDVLSGVAERVQTVGVRWRDALSVGMAVGFLLLAELALERAPTGSAPGAERLIVQFAVSIAAGHVAVSLLTPAAPPLLPVACMLAAVGLAFTMRLAPEAAAAQANWVSVGIAAFVAGLVAGRRAHLLRRWTYTAGVLALAVLGATALFGTTINGARLWIDVAGQSVQTTELIKALLVVFLAGYLAREAGVFAQPGPLWRRWRFLLPLLVLWVGTLGALVALRDLGTLAILAALAAVMLAMASGRPGFLVAGAALIVATALIGYATMGHVRTRVDTWLHPFDDPLGSGYQTTQASFAFANGGVTGVGLGWGMADTIPAVATDYVFAAVAEELGMAGATAVVLAFALLVVGGLQAAAQAGDAYRRWLAASVAVLFGVQAAVIIAGNLRLVPTTGVTLPFVSYGGSSLVVNFALLGLQLGAGSGRHR